MTVLLPVAGLVLLIFAAMACLCRASLYRSRERARAATARTLQRQCRIGGWLLLGLSTVLATRLFPWDVGLVCWLGAVSLVAFFLVGFATYRPHWLGPALPLSLAVGLAISGWSLLFSLGDA